MSDQLSGVAEKVAEAESCLVVAMRLLDDAHRYDVSAHVDLALHVLRGTRNQSFVPDPDILA